MEKVNTYMGARGPRGRALIELVMKASRRALVPVDIKGDSDVPCCTVTIESLGLVTEGPSLAAATDAMEREVWALFDDPARRQQLSVQEAQFMLRLLSASADNYFGQQIFLDYVDTSDGWVGPAPLPWRRTVSQVS